MKKALFLLLFFVSFDGLAITLEQAFKKAIENEQVQAIEAQIEQARERTRKIEGGLYPEINLTGAITRQEDDEVFRRGFGQQTQKSLQLQLVQPLFQGFKEFAALRMAKADSRRQQLLLEQAKLNLYQNLAETFYNIKSLENEIALTRELVRLSKERVGFLQQRVNVGRSRRSELISAQAQLVNVEASMVELTSSLNRQREAFGLVTNLPINSELKDQAVPDFPQELSKLLLKLENSPWMQVRDREVEIAEESIKIAKANHWPYLDLRANYYLERGGSLQGVNWDVGVALTMPLYSGGSDEAGVREALAKKRETLLSKSYEMKRLETEIKATHNSLVQVLTQIKSYEKAVTLNKRNYDELHREYGLGLVTNLDVINALNQYVQSRRELNRIKVTSFIDSAKLKALTGEIL